MNHHEPDQSKAADLVRCAQQGSPAAFDRLAEKYRPLLLAMAFMRTNDREQSQDLVQDVFTKAWQALPSLQNPDTFFPWLKTIMANACHNWYRQSKKTLVISSMHVADNAVDPSLPPLERLLTRETQREIWKALMQIPEDNRLALLMHVWEGSTYEEIAALTGVPVTTVEGRIFRAKRRLQNLMFDHGEKFLQIGDPMITKKPTGRSKKVMATSPKATMQINEQNEWHVSQTLIAFSRRFAVMIDGGVTLVRALYTLEELPVPYGPAAQKLRLQIEKGEMLSKAMGETPALFSQCYCGLIRAGEVGGILEETLGRAAELLHKEAKLAAQRPDSEVLLLLLGPRSKPLPEDWASLTPYQKKMVQVLFLETYGMLLSSGVPILRTLETVCILLPSQQAKIWKEARAAVADGKPMMPVIARSGMFSQFVLAMIHTGEERGCLDQNLHKAAEALEAELDLGILD